MAISLLVSASEDSLIARAIRRVRSALSLTYENSLLRRASRRLLSPSGVPSKAIQSALTTRVIASLLSAISVFICKIQSRLRVSEKGALAESKLLGELVSPLAFIVLSVAFFGFADVKYSPQTILVISLGLLSFWLGALWAGLEARLIRTRIRASTTLYMGLAMVAVGYFGFLVQVLKAGGIPILNEEVRRRLVPLYNYLAWTGVPGMFYILSSLERGEDCGFKARLLSIVFLGFIPTFLIGFRTEMMAYFVGVLVVVYHRRFIGRTSFLLLLCSGILLYFLVSGARLIFSGLVVNPLAAAAYRPTITTGFLDGIVKRYGLNAVTGGNIHLSSFSSLFKWVPGPRYGPRTIIGSFAGGRSGTSTTATILAQFLLDFGLIGVITGMLILGFVLNLSFKMALLEEALLGPYATLLAYSLVGIETGILDVNVYAYMLLSVATVLLSSRLRGHKVRE